MKMKKKKNLIQESNAHLGDDQVEVVAVHVEGVEEVDQRLEAEVEHQAEEEDGVAVEVGQRQEAEAEHQVEEEDGAAEVDQRPEAELEVQAEELVVFGVAEVGQRPEAELGLQVGELVVFGVAEVDQHPEVKLGVQADGVAGSGIKGNPSQKHQRNQVPGLKLLIRSKQHSTLLEWPLVWV